MYALHSEIIHDICFLQDLARKYALSFGFDRYDAHKVRQPLMGIHRCGSCLSCDRAWYSRATVCLLCCRDGITFALEQLEDTVEGGTPVPPPNLDFLQVLSEFTYRLLEVDRTGKKGVAAYLEDQLPDGLWERVERLAEWEPLRSYIRNLTGREQATDTTNQSEQATASQVYQRSLDMSLHVHLRFLLTVHSW